MYEVGSDDPAPEVVLRAMVEEATSSVPGCRAASARLVQLDAPIAQLCSHPELADLDTSDSPEALAAVAGGPVGSADLLTEVRWPAFCDAALGRGLRSLVAGAHPVLGGRLTCTLYAVRPRGLGPRPETAVQALLDVWSGRLERSVAYSGARAEAHHLTEAMAARELVEQAKGMLMQALRCDAESAYAELSRSARRSKIRTVDMARRLVEHAEVTNRSRSAPPRRSEIAH